MKKAEITNCIREITGIGQCWIERARLRQQTLTKPPGSLGRLEEIGNRIAAILETEKPGPLSKRVYVVAADHGVTQEGVSAYPREVTSQMVFNFLNGGAAINVLGRHGGIDVRVVDAGVDFDFQDAVGLVDRKILRGTANFARGPAMSREQAEECIAAGIELARQSHRDGITLLGIGEMGIGNTTAASAITAVLTKSDPTSVTGRGTGVDDERLARKASIIARAIEINSVSPDDPIDVLAKVGGAEIGVMMGIVLGAAAERVPIVADGFISTAAAALAFALAPSVRDFLFIAHLSQEPGHRALASFVGLDPLLNLDMRLGEGTGAALAMQIIEGSAKLLSEMATFDEAGVSGRRE